MKRAFCLAMFFFCLLIPRTICGQTIDATVCDVLANPQSFDGKIVRITGVVIAGFEEFAVKGSGCNQPVNAIWLSYPTGTKGKAGPAAFLRLQLGGNHPAAVSNTARAAVTLERNKDFKDFDDFLSTAAKTSTTCLGCVRYMVMATLVGRLDGAKDVGFLRDASGRVIGLGGFGHLNQYSARLVLQSVSQVVRQEIDYTKPGAAASGDAALGSRSLAPGTIGGDQARRGVDAFGAPGEDNGVSVGFSGANEVPKDDTLKSLDNSPDGLLFHVTFDQERLKGPALQVALAHVGTHIADLRSPTAAIAAESFYAAEFRGWQASVVSAVAAKVKTLGLPGSYIAYNQAWSNPEMAKNTSDGISGFLANWAAITNPPRP